MQFPKNEGFAASDSAFPMQEPANPSPNFSPSTGTESTSPQSPEKVLCLRVTYWLIGFLALNALLIILIIGCLATPRWIQTGNTMLNIEGGLLKCSHCDDPFSGLSYHEASGSSVCDEQTPDYSGYCSMFKDLQGAGGAYLFFELVALLFILFWIVKLGLQLKGSLFLSNPRWLAYVIAPVSTASHILGLIIWGGVTRSTFHGNCSQWGLDGSKPELCSTDGPGLSIAIMVFLLLGTGVYCFFHWKSAPTALKSSTNQQFRAPGYANRPPEDTAAREPQFSPAIEIQIPDNI